MQRVVVHYNSLATKESANETVQFIKNNGGDAFSIQLDLTKVTNIKLLFEETEKKIWKS